MIKTKQGMSISAKHKRRMTQLWFIDINSKTSDGKEYFEWMDIQQLIRMPGCKVTTIPGLRERLQNKSNNPLFTTIEGVLYTEKLANQYKTKKPEKLRKTPIERQFTSADRATAQVLSNREFNKFMQSWPIGSLHKQALIMQGYELCKN